MPLYEFHGSDSSSDAGSFTIIVRANNQDDAETFATTFLIENGRRDLEISYKCQLSNRGSNIIYSDLEPRNS
jgi:hypothetical protein